MTPRKEAEHGTIARYTSKKFHCRCDKCKEAARLYRLDYRKRCPEAYARTQEQKYRRSLETGSRQAYRERNRDELARKAAERFQRRVSTPEGYAEYTRKRREYERANRSKINARKRGYTPELTDEQRAAAREYQAIIRATKEYQEYIKNYRRTRGRECRQRALDRTAPIRAKAVNAGLPWTSEEDIVIMKDTYTSVEAAAIIGRTPRAVEIRRSAILRGLVATEAQTP